MGQIAQSARAWWSFVLVVRAELEGSCKIFWFTLDQAV